MTEDGQQHSGGARPDLAQVDLFVQELEAGMVPAGFADRFSAARSLIEQFCNVPWQSKDEREQAQVLVLRLELVIDGRGDGKEV